MPLPIYKILDRYLSTLNLGITSVNLRRNIIPAFIAICLIGGTVYLGFQSLKDNRFVIWFGLACASAVPVGLNLFTYAFRRSDREIIQQLAKVPEIEKLIQ
jgi:NADH:ubiquinone oxidoreductase subunit K